MEQEPKDPPPAEQPSPFEARRQAHRETSDLHVTPKMLSAQRREINARRRETGALHDWPCLCDDCVLEPAVSQALRLRATVAEEDARRQARALELAQRQAAALEAEVRCWREAQRALEIAAACGREFQDAADRVRELAPDTGWQRDYPARRSTDPQPVRHIPDSDGGL